MRGAVAKGRPVASVDGVSERRGLREVKPRGAALRKIFVAARMSLGSVGRHRGSLPVIGPLVGVAITKSRPQAQEALALTPTGTFHRSPTARAKGEGAWLRPSSSKSSVGRARASSARMVKRHGSPLTVVRSVGARRHGGVGG